MMRSLRLYAAMQAALKQAHMLSSAILAGSGASLLYLLHIYTTSSQRVEAAVLNQSTIELVQYLVLPSAGFSIATGAIICLAERRAAFSCHYMVTKGMNALTAVALGAILYFGLGKLAAAASDIRGVSLAGHVFQVEDVLGGTNLLAAVLMGTILFVLYNVVHRPCADAGGCKLCSCNGVRGAEADASFSDPSDAQ
ncbi:hypothetical protein KP005_05115 [Geomonas nitrogeniifigens]|uniref:Uncharacterized protein n=1 Tax=Geomonas diazotrophica TaxID=2843197 RepID=A0ABX8JTC5_9BACT|nr:hypothetical protein [Geomonas nitrogeniifigens]QWV98670.1 hypothetical protein KP005_05115 [Geomonas nitrogeniifigens]